MPLTNFDLCLPYEHMTIFSPSGESYNGYYVDPAINRNTLPEGWYAYDIRHDDDGCYIFCQLCSERVVVNCAGSFITNTRIEEIKDGSYVEFKVDSEEWKLAHEGDVHCPENSDDDWEYTFGGNDG